VKNVEFIETPPFLDYISERLRPSFTHDPNSLGASELSFPKSKRKIVYYKVYKFERMEKVATLMGTIIHFLLESDYVKNKIIAHINKQLGIKGNDSITEKEYRSEVLPGKWIRMHPDIEQAKNIIETPNYIVEIKTTKQGLRQLDEFGEVVWQKKGAPQHVRQLNIYSVFRGAKKGLLFMINVMAFFSQTRDFEKLLKQYSFILSFDPQPELYDETVDLAKEIFGLIDAKDFTCQCPTHAFECKDCAAVDKCMNPIDDFILPYEEECFSCKETLKTKWVDKKGKTRNTHVFKRNGNIYCKSEACTEACLNAWEGKQ